MSTRPQKSFDKQVLIEALAQLSKASCIAFGISCCERIYPNYVAFSQATRWGDSDILRASLDMAWHHLDDEKLTCEVASRYSEQCELAIPSSDDFGNALSTYAQDSALAVCTLLDYFCTSELERIAQTASFAVDTVDLFVQDVDEIPAICVDREDRILQHELMQSEIRRQWQDIGELADGWSFRELFGKWASPMRSNIGLPLEQEDVSAILARCPVLRVVHPPSGGCGAQDPATPR